MHSIVAGELDRTIVQSLVQMGCLMGMRTVAAYVENAAIRDAVRALGVDFTQGYGIDHAQPLGNLLAGHGGTRSSLANDDGGQARP